MPDLLPNSGLIVEVPAAEAAVGRHRELLDVNARGGVPAHVTVLYPFMSPHLIDADVLSELARTFAEVPAFGVDLTFTSWFGEQVVWVAPADPEPFRALTGLVHSRFPEYPPFAGLFDDVVPHLTVGHGGDLEGMRLAEKLVQEHLPIRTAAREVTLMTQDEPDGVWTTLARFALGSRAPVSGAGVVEASGTSVLP